MNYQFLQHFGIRPRLPRSDRVNYWVPQNAGCGARGAGKCQRVKCREKYGELPCNLQTQTHLGRVQPRILHRAYRLVIRIEGNFYGDARVICEKP